MKKIKIVFSFVILLAVTASCGIPDGISQDLTLDTTVTPTGVAGLINITDDNSGNVNITPSASGAGTFDVYFGDGTSNPANVQFGGNITHKYVEGNYTIKIVARGLNGVNAEKTYPISIVYRAPESITVTFTKKVHNLKVKASALYAASYLVYFGDSGVSEVGTPLANGEEISHNYATAGSYNVKVIALSGGAAKTEKITAVTINDAFELPITFENPNVVYSFVSSGNVTFTKVANPKILGINTSATVGKFFKINNASANAATTSLLDNPIDFSTGNIVRVWVYNVKPSDVGKKLNVELESAVGGSPINGVAVLKVPITTFGAWEELVFDFSTIPGIPANTKFNQIVFRLNDAALGKSETVYLDNIRLTN